MTASESLLLCRECKKDVALDGACPGCSWQPRRVNTIIDTIGDTELQGAVPKVSEFYSESPFPGYAPEDDATSILDRAHGNPFLTALDQAIAPDARVLDCGCGTGQIPCILSLRARGRTVVGVDATLAQLQEAERFKLRVDIPNLHLMRADIFSLPLAEQAFDVVISRGVVHHTYDPNTAIREVAKRVAPGGFLIIGYYDAVGRIPHRIRRVLSKVRGKPINVLDPILKRPDLSEEKKRNWIMDQYYHPVEKILSLQSVKDNIMAEGLDWVRTVPPMPVSGNLLEETAEPGLLGRALVRLGWMFTGIGDEDAGLVGVIGRRQARS